MKNLIQSHFFKAATCALILILFVSNSQAQGILDSVSRDESDIVSAIAPYPPDLRIAILEVSKYPQTLVKIERAQARSSQEFQDIIARYPRDQQEKFYQVVRFPGVVAELLSLGSMKMNEANEIIGKYPEGSQNAIRDIYQYHFDDLSTINRLFQASLQVLDKVTAKYSPEVQSEFRRVVDNPDVMTLLTDNIDLTVSLGESYKGDPVRVVAYLDSLNARITAQGAKDLKDYQAAVSADPKMQEEMKKAAKEFEKNFDGHDSIPVVMNNNYYGTSPYPYWFGYPYWYGSPMWYPMPFYYNTGFYLGLNGGLVVFGFPSYAYANWFFAHGHSRYQHLYNHYQNYYNVHRGDLAGSNPYRGFNSATQHHFSPRQNVPMQHRNPVFTRPRQNNTNHRQPRSSQHNFSRPMNSDHFNNRSFNHYNANSFHSMGWQGMHNNGARGRH